MAEGQEVPPLECDAGGLGPACAGGLCVSLGLAPACPPYACSGRCGTKSALVRCSVAVCRIEGRRQQLADAFGMDDPAHHAGAFERQR